MSLSTYSDLQTSIANYLARSDLTSQIPDFITFAENRLRRELRIRQMLSVHGIILCSPFTFVNVTSQM